MRDSHVGFTHWTIERCMSSRARVRSQTATSKKSLFMWSTQQKKKSKCICCCIYTHHTVNRNWFLTTVLLMLLLWSHAPKNQQKLMKEVLMMMVCGLRLCIFSLVNWPESIDHSPFSILSDFSFYFAAWDSWHWFDVWWLEGDGQRLAYDIDRIRWFVITE